MTIENMKERREIMNMSVSDMTGESKRMNVILKGVGIYMMMIDQCVSSHSHMHRLHLKVFMLTPLTLRSKDLFLLICLSLQVFRMRMLTHTCLASIILVPP